jgi:hypothetical protein
MPRVILHGVTESGEDKNFELLGGCFQILGRYSSNLETLQSNKNARGIEEFKVLEWDIKYSTGGAPPDESCLSFLKYVFQIHDFMECVNETPEQIIETGIVTFDLQKQDFFKILHAL